MRTSHINRSIPTLIASIILCVAPVGAASFASSHDIDVSKMALMTFEGQIEIQASPDQVWADLTNANKVQSWCPLWKEGKADKDLTSVGRTITFEDSYGNRGKSVVLFVDSGKELRIAHVPDSGEYLCQVTFKLTPKGPGTVVHVAEAYSDAIDVPVDSGTAATVKVEIARYMSDLKSMSEGEHAAGH